jgi:LacI family transcriptional regulator
MTQGPPEMTRPTIRDLAREAGVSVSTVNRVLAGDSTVRDHTVQQVKDTAERVGYYGVRAIQAKIITRKPKLRFGFLLQQPSRKFYKMIGAELEKAARAHGEQEIETEIFYAEDLAPQVIAAKLVELGGRCSAVGVVTAVHPLVTNAVNVLQANNVPVFALISQLSQADGVNYVGLDNWKLGRASAWAFHHICKSPGKIGVLVGNYRYRCQEMNEIGFRSYFREVAPEFTILEPLATFETNAVAEEMTEQLINDHPDLVGLFIAGGGISGAMNALRTRGQSGKIMGLGFDLTDNTRAGLLDGTLTMVLGHPLERLAEEAVAGMLRAIKLGAGSGKQIVILPFETYTRESI